MPSRGKTQPVPPLAERMKPGLSETLPFARQVDTCQSCGATWKSHPLAEFRWFREFDPYDMPTSVIVILCDQCWWQITPHARIYATEHKNAPMPGAMELCLGCRFAVALRCTSPRLKSNGGEGLRVEFPRPDTVHLNYGGGRGEFKQMWKGPPTRCAGRALATE